MCTVTYIPKSDSNFILTTNRDENAGRATRNLDRTKQNGQELLFPRDFGAGGTWVALSSTNRVVCLLNGAFTKHQHQPPYKKSRGLMVLDFFDYPTAETFTEQYDFAGMEPFTMIMLENGTIRVLRWDEQQVHQQQLDPNGKYIWSSATLYSPEVQAERERWFQEWLEGRTDFSQAAILDFHRNGGKKDNWNGFVMNRNDFVQTVSITSIAKHHDRLDMRYESLIHNELTEAGVQFEPSNARP